MRTSVKDLKKWVNTLSEDAIISVNTYKNNREKSFIVATQYDEKGKAEEKEFLVSIEEDDGFVG